MIIRYEDKEIILDNEDFRALPSGYYFKFDKDGYPLLYWYSHESRREENVRLARWVMHNPKGKLVDHINRNKLDTRKQNLRLATHAQNSQNQGPKRTKQGSPYKGVYWVKALNKFSAGIKLNGKSYHLGTFLDPWDAAQAYNAAAKEAYGEFAFLNVEQTSPDLTS